MGLCDVVACLWQCVCGVEVRWCPLQSGAFRLKSDNDPCDLALAVEVRSRGEERRRGEGGGEEL